MSTALKQSIAVDAVGENPLLNHPQVRALIYSVLSNGLNFNDLEFELSKILRELFCSLLSAALENIDLQLMYSAKRLGWEVKDSHDRSIESSLGVIQFSRRYYCKTTEMGGKIYGHLLDDVLGLEKGKNITPRLLEMIVALASENSYRTSSKLLEELLGIKISHEGIRQAVQGVGQHLSKWDKPNGLDGRGQKEVPLLVIEVDGVNVKQQVRNNPKKNRKDQKKFELKTAVIYEGWEQDGQKSRLKNPMYFVYLGEGKEFWLALERHLGRYYSLESCQRIIVGGDGASWIKHGAENIGAEYQYCRFHMERDLRRLFKNQEDIRKALKDTIKTANLESFNMIVDAVITDADKDRKDALDSYKSLMNNVWEGVTDWRERGKPVSDNARGLGVIESNVGHTVARRFKHRCASWSHDGAINLAKVRCALRNGTLKELIRVEGPPEADATVEETVAQISDSYWVRRSADGLRKVNPGDWCNTQMPGSRSSSQVARDFAMVMKQLSTEVLF